VSGGVQIYVNGIFRLYAAGDDLFTEGGFDQLADRPA
jgi:hypothetical protein